MVLSHQIMAQLPSLLAKTIVGTVGSLLCFASPVTMRSSCTPTCYDQTRLAHVNIAAPINFTATPNFFAWTKLLSDGAPTSTRLTAIRPPLPVIAGRLEAIRARNRARHMRPRAKVEAEITRFLDPPGRDEIHMIVGKNSRKQVRKTSRSRQCGSDRSMPAPIKRTMDEG